MKTINDAIFTLQTPDLEAMIAQERSFIDPKVLGGRVRVASFAFNTGATSVVTPATDTAATLIALAVLPAGAEILQIAYDHEAMGALATMDLGLYEFDGTEVDKDVFLDADDVAAAGAHVLTPISRTAGESLVKTTTPVVLVAIANVAADWADDKDLKGLVLYTVNS